MNRSMLAVFSGLLIWLPVAAYGQGATAQVERGRQLFQQSPKGLACATCHSMEGHGNAIGPDLKTLASVVGPRGLIMTIQMSMTAYVREYSNPNGTTFPGIQKSKANGVVEVWDLSKVPGVLRTLKESEISSVKPNSKWKHPPSSADYSQQELADIAGYLKFASTGVAKEVGVGELH